MLIALIIFLIIIIILWVTISLRHKNNAVNNHDEYIPKHKRLTRKQQERLDTIARLKPDIEAAFADISKYYSYSHYITETERLTLAGKYDDLDIEIKPLLNCKELAGLPEKELFNRFHTAMMDTNAHKKANNNHFVQNELSRCAQYFDTVLTHPLDNQQREAVVSLEDNVLVISSAGSGKTMTTVGKVRYLIDVQHVPAEKILLITFTRKAAESLSERLGEKNLKCRTFHKLALDIIG